MQGRFTLKWASVALMLLFGVAVTVKAQNKISVKKELRSASIPEMISAHEFIFKSYTAIPTKGKPRHLAGRYDINIKKNYLISDLPYFGRVYAPSPYPIKASLDFKSSLFTYLVKLGKNGRWEVTIKPEDNREIQQLFFTIFDDGFATLKASFYTRDAITFHGYIEPEKGSKKLNLG
ncbi:MAG TPA: DUF4251 domain-containing protein [Hanamia sp.]|nr:DUF4251 domain-containing protein [Hanamia sp.]